MEFTVEFYETDSGRFPFRDFLDHLKETGPNDFAAIMAGLAKLKNRQYHRPPLSKPIGGDLFELRHVGKLNTRVFTFSLKGKESLLFMGLGIKQEGFRLVILRLPWKENAIGWRGMLHEGKNKFRHLS